MKYLRSKKFHYNEQILINPYNMKLHTTNSILVSLNVSFDQLMFFHEVLHRCQVLAGILRREQTLDLCRILLSYNTVAY